MNTGVFERKSSAEQSGEMLSAVQYNLIIGAVLLWGFVINFLILEFIPVRSVQSIDSRIFLIGYFASCFLGVTLFNRSTNPWISFLGYNFIVVPFGLVLNIFVSYFSQSLVLDSIRITGLVTLIMIALGTSFPKFFEKIIGALTIALLGVIVVELVEIFIFKIHHDIIDWIVALIFCGYVGYDWSRANAIPKTIDNAVDSAAALYMDIINLFVRILSILGKKRR